MDLRLGPCPRGRSNPRVSAQNARIPKVRKALITLAKYVQHKLSPIEQDFQTGLKPRQIEEAIRWEQRTAAVAA
jgi:hypothetical protein